MTEIVDVPPITASIVIVAEPLFKADGQTPYAGNLEDYCRSLCAFVKGNFEDSFSERRGADLAIVVCMRRGTETVGIRYKDGHFLALEKEKKDAEEA